MPSSPRRRSRRACLRRQRSCSVERSLRCSPSRSPGSHSRSSAASARRRAEMGSSKLVLLRAVYLAAFLALFTAYVSEAASPIRELTNTTASNLRPAWSPDGKRIAFQSNRNGSYHIYVMDSDGGNVVQLTNGDADDRHPAWSPDGKFVAVDSGDAAKREIWTIEVSSKRRTQVTKLGAITSFPIYLPDGSLIYVSEHVTIDQSWTDLWMVDPNATNTIDARSAVAGQIQAQGPFELSTDARQLLFASPRSGNFEIYSVTLDAAGKAALAEKPVRIIPDLSAAESKVVEKGFRLPDSPEPYILVAGLLAFAVVGVESIVRARRRSRAKPKL